MGINYGIRGGDVIDIGQVNNYIKSLEIISNINVVVNTKFFENNIDNQVSSIFFLPTLRRICVASVYILRSSVATPTVYPSIPTMINIQNNTNLTETNVSTNTQVFNAVLEGIEYKVCILRRTITVNTTDIYVQCKFSPIGNIKNLSNTGLSQFLVWTDPEAEINFGRLVDGQLSSYSDFSQLFRVPDFSSYSSCLLNSLGEILIIEKGTGGSNPIIQKPVSSFFLCDNFTDSFLRKVRFLISNANTYDFFRIIQVDQVNPDVLSYTYNSIELTLENTYTNYCEYSITNLSDFRKSIQAMKRGIDDNLISVVGCYQDVDYYTVDVNSVCVKVPNNPYAQITPVSQYSLSPVNLFPLRQNSQTPHIAVNFQGNIGDGENSLITTNSQNNYRISFENGLIDVFTNEFTYALSSGYGVLFGVGF